LQIFKPEVGQPELFRSIVLPRVMEFLEGQNQLLFTYGATSAGKTYTIQVQQPAPTSSSFLSFLELNFEFPII
jgi:hypothetical protein